MPETIKDLVTSLLWDCLSKTSDQLKLPIYSSVLSSPIVIQKLFSKASIAFTPELGDVLQASIPPSTSFFKSLTNETHGRWGVYVLVLEKDSHQSKIYIESGTDSQRGLPSRFYSYEKGVLLPRHVAKAIKEGFNITHKGLLCWAPIPEAALTPITRVLFLAIEALFTFTFWAVKSNTEHGLGMVNISLWNWTTLPYDGLCSHSSLMELPQGDHGLSPEEPKAQALKRQVERQPRLNNNVKRCREKAKKADPEGYAAKGRETARKRRDAHPDATKETIKRSIAKAVKEGRHYCPVCDHTFTKKAKLTTHLAGPKHAAKVALQKEGVKDPKLYCAVCNHEFTRKAHMDEHLAGKRHAAKAARLNEVVNKDLVSQQN